MCVSQNLPPLFKPLYPLSHFASNMLLVVSVKLFASNMLLVVSVFTLASVKWHFLILMEVLVTNQKCKYKLLQ